MAETTGNFLSAFGKLGIIVVSAALFVLGLVGTVYLSLRSPEVQVPDVVNKTYQDGTAALGQAGLDISERAQRYKPDVQPGVILDQTPHAGEVVKSGQTVRVVVSRSPREGEQQPAAIEEVKKDEDVNKSKNDNVGESGTASKNENRDRRNKNTNKNANGNLNANRRNLNNSNNVNSAPSNTNNANANRNANRNQNQNVNSTLNVNRNRNPGNRNVNTVRTNSNVNRQP